VEPPESFFTHFSDSDRRGFAVELSNVPSKVAVVGPGKVVDAAPSAVVVGLDVNQTDDVVHTGDVVVALVSML
jgi:hypothetical protein